MILEFPQRFQAVSHGTESGDREATTLQASRGHINRSCEVFFRFSSPTRISCSDDGCQRKAAALQIWNCGLSDQSNDYCCIHAKAVAARFDQLVRSLCRQYPDHSLRKPHWEAGIQNSSTAPLDTAHPIPEIISSRSDSFTTGLILIPVPPNPARGQESPRPTQRTLRHLV
jgi:hypothetical protein